MRNLILLILMVTTVTVQAQVAQYMVICDDSKVEVISADEVLKFPNAVVLKDKLPSRMAADSWITSNQSLIACGTQKVTPTVAPVVTPPPAVPDPADVQAPPPPEKRVTHIYPNKFSFFGTVLFPQGNWGDWIGMNPDYDRFIPFMAGFNFRKGNKAKFGFEMAFHGLAKFESSDPDDKEMMANATLAFLFSYPVAMDKQGRFWFVPEVGLGVDFFDVMQLIDKDDKLIAGPYLLVRVGVEMYHLMPFFYYGQSFMDVSKGDYIFPLKPSHIGVGLAIPF